MRDSWDVDPILDRAWRAGPHTEMHFRSDTPVLIVPPRRDDDNTILLRAFTYLRPDDAREVAAELVRYADKVEGRK